MATLRDIRNRISGVQSIEKITSAMKMVSSVKVRKAQRQAENARPFFNKTEQILISLVASEQQELNNPLLAAPKEANEIKNLIVFIIAGDKGLCGSFNSALFKMTDLYLRDIKKTYPNAEPKLVVIGNKAVEHYEKQNYEIIHRVNNAFQPLDYSIVLDINKKIINKFLLGEIDYVEIFYSQFINMMKQEPTSFQLLPLISQESFEEVKKTQNDFMPEYILEPERKIIIDTLVDQYVNLKVWKALLESNAAEQSARLFAMDKATQNANDLIKELRLQFNNARQAAITSEMLEIVSGAEALNK